MTFTILVAFWLARVWLGLFQIFTRLKRYSFNHHPKKWCCKSRTGLGFQNWRLTVVHWASNKRDAATDSNDWYLKFWLSMDPFPIWREFLIGGWALPSLRKIWVRQLGWLDIPNIWENRKWQPNHQPDEFWREFFCFRPNKVLLQGARTACKIAGVGIRENSHRMGHCSNVGSPKKHVKCQTTQKKREAFYSCCEIPFWLGSQHHLHSRAGEPQR